MIGQQSVSLAMAAGVVGEIFLGSQSSLRAQPAILDSDNITVPNRIGRVFTLVAGADGHAVVGGPGALAGILANPKEFSLYGTAAGGPLAPSLDLPQYAVGQFVYDTAGIFVALGAAANVGDYCYYNTTTGIISTQAGGSVSAGVGTLAITSNVATVASMPTGLPPIGVGTVLNTAAGPATVLSLGTGTGGNGTYNTSVIANQSAAAFTYEAAAPAGTKRLTGFQVVRYSIPGAGLAVIGNLN